MVAVVAFGFSVLPARSATLALYDFESNSLNPGVVHTHTFWGAVGPGAGLSLFESTATNTRGLPDGLYSGGNDGVLQVRSATKGDEANAIANSAYFDLLVTPESGYEVSFTNLTFNAGSTGNSQPRLIYVHANTGAGYISLGDSGALRVDGVTAANISLASLGTQSGPVAFRFYAVYDVAGTPTLGIDDIVFNGSVAAVPEGHQWVFVMVGAAILCQRLRRRRVAA